MQVELNGRPVETAAQTLAALVAEQGFDATVVATALDGVFVPRGDRVATPIAAGARVEVLSPMQGG
ncbi:MAG: sulfur carrier protein ThiS [Rhodobacteraceae bacterium]|nr:sulfur carrier protein ThiS [Paracoccaceae bacterium]